MYYDYYLYYLNYLSSMYHGYPLIVRMTVLMVTCLALLTVYGLLRLLYLGLKIRLEEKCKKKTADYFDDKLTFVMDSTSNYDVEEIQNLLAYNGARDKCWKAEFVTERVLKIKNQLSKQYKLNVINYKNCLEVLSIMGFWEKRIRTSGLDKRKEAMQVVGDLNNGVNSGILSKSTFHKNSFVRKTARDLYTSQDNYQPFRFMEENFDETFTELDKLRLHATLVKRSQEGKLPNLMRWVNGSKNPKYILFILKEIGYFKQYAAVDALQELLLKHENKDVRAQVVMTLGELNCYDCIELFIARYAIESTTVQAAIIKTMGKLNGQVARTFLGDAYWDSVDANTKLLVARSMHSQGREGDEVLRELQNDEHMTDKDFALLNQVFAERIMI